MVPEMIQKMVEKIKVIQQNMIVAQDRIKSYVDQRQKPSEFELGDEVFLKVLPIKGIWRFNVKRKLSPQFVRTYEIIEKINLVSHCLALLLE